MLPLQNRWPVSLIVKGSSRPTGSTCRRAGGYTCNEGQPHAGSSEAAALDLEQGAVSVQSRRSVNVEWKTKTEYSK